MSVALSAAVAEVSAALRALHVVASLRTLDVNLQTDTRGGEIQYFLTFVGLGLGFGKEEAHSNGPIRFFLRCQVAMRCSI